MARPYTVVVAVVIRHQSTDDPRQREQDDAALRHAAAGAVLERALACAGINRGVALHSSVGDGRQFAEAMETAYRGASDDCPVFHVNGYMARDTRERAIAGYVTSQKAILTRADRGGAADVVGDIVAILIPRPTAKDIRQALGHCDWSRGDHPRCYIVVPLIVDRADDSTLNVTDDGIAATAAVLRLLADRDDNLAGALREAQGERGRTGQCSVTHLRGLIDIRYSESEPAKLYDAVAHGILRRVGSAWDLMCGRLLAHRDEVGHCRASECADPGLAAWIRAQRRRRRQKRLPQEQIEKLNDVGFIWRDADEEWEVQFDALAAFHAQHGHINVPEDWPEDPALPRWAGLQGRLRSADRLGEDQRRRFDGLGLDWHTAGDAWEEQYTALLHFREVHGHGNVPLRWAENPRLGRWVAEQRVQVAQGRLAADRVGRLQDAGLMVDPRAARWDAQYARLVEFHDCHGHADVPYGWHEDAALARWLANQRLLYRRGRLDPVQIARMDELGVVWAMHPSWDEWIAKLVDYVERHGHASPSRTDPDFPGLGRWAVSQRQLRKQGKLSPYQIKQLDHLGFEWERPRRVYPPQH